MRYKKRLSGPILDRIDIHVNVPFVEVKKLKMRQLESGKRETSKQIRERVMKARGIQLERFKKEKIFSNAEMKNKQVKKYSQLSQEAENLLQRAANNFQLSARSYYRLIKVGRTIADLGGEGEISQQHIAEALQYRIREEV